MVPFTHEILMYLGCVLAYVLCVCNHHIIFHTRREAPTEEAADIDDPAPGEDTANDNEDLVPPGAR